YLSLFGRYRRWRPGHIGDGGYGAARCTPRLPQCPQIVRSARSLNPVLGDAVMWALIFLYAALLSTPFVLWFRLPKRVLPPVATKARRTKLFWRSSSGVWRATRGCGGCVWILPMRSRQRLRSSI